MKKLIGILFITFITSGCSHNRTISEQKPADREKNRQDSISKHKADSLEIIKNKTYQVSGIVFYRKMWCGGVQINPKDNSYKSKPFANKKIVVIKGIVNSDTSTRLQELKTNAKGEFTFDAKAGQYGIIIEDWKQVKFNMRDNDPENSEMISCLRKKHKEPDLIVKITDKPVEKLVYTVIGYCNGGNVCNPNGGNNRP